MAKRQDSMSVRWRLISAADFLFGAGIVVGHNVFHVVPNEVPILCVMGLISVRVRDVAWSAMGFRRAASWRRILVIALAAAALRIVLGDLVIEPLAARIWPPIVAPAGANEIAGNISKALLALLIVWTFAPSAKRSRTADICSPGSPIWATDPPRAAGSVSSSSPCCSDSATSTRARPASWTPLSQD
jgi:hypothetical protein